MAWVNSLPIHLEPAVAATVTKAIVNDTLDRHKYLQKHPEAKSGEKYELENLNYQVFRRMSKVADPRALPNIMKRAPDLYRTFMAIEPQLLETKNPPAKTRDRNVF